MTRCTLSLMVFITLKAIICEEVTAGEIFGTGQTDGCLELWEFNNGSGIIGTVATPSSRKMCQK